MTLTLDGLALFEEAARTAIAQEIDRGRGDDPPAVLFVGGPADCCEPSSRQLAEWGFATPPATELRITLGIAGYSASYYFGWTLREKSQRKAVYLYEGTTPTEGLPVLDRKRSSRGRWPSPDDRDIEADGARSVRQPTGGMGGPAQ